MTSAGQPHHFDQINDTRVVWELHGYPLSTRVHGLFFCSLLDSLGSFTWIAYCDKNSQFPFWKLGFVKSWFHSKGLELNDSNYQDISYKRLTTRFNQILIYYIHFQVKIIWFGIRLSVFCSTKSNSFNKLNK